MNYFTNETIIDNNEESFLNLIHFNDVYNIENSSIEPKAGAARFLTAINKLKNESTLVLFSGDAFSPSSCK
jgi:2',3'-cyclic-nucleotide 2'-phosphodiesterase (5'-nucleotidase family)